MVASGSPRALRVRCGYVYRDVSWMYLNVFHLLRKIHSEYTQDRYITTSVSQDTESTMYLRQPERKPRTKRAAQTSSRRLESSFQGTVPGLWPQLRVRCPVGTVGDLVSTMIRALAPVPVPVPVPGTESRGTRNQLRRTTWLASSSSSARFS